MMATVFWGSRLNDYRRRTISRTIRGREYLTNQSRSQFWRAPDKPYLPVPFLPRHLQKFPPVPKGRGDPQVLPRIIFESIGAK